MRPGKVLFTAVRPQSNRCPRYRGDNSMRILDIPPWDMTQKRILPMNACLYPLLAPIGLASGSETAAC